MNKVSYINIGLYWVLITWWSFEFWY